MDQDTTTPSEKQPPQCNTLHPQTTRTSFLIEDILYRHQKEMANNCTTFSHYHPQSSKTPYFPQQQQHQQQQQEGGYVQVMGALGAYLGATPYNTISDPYFGNLTLFKSFRYMTRKILQAYHFIMPFSVLVRSL